MPRVRLLPIRPAAPSSRPWGLWKGKVRMSDDFDAPLDDFDGYR